MRKRRRCKMIERIEIGSSPWGEDCAQVGSDTYYDVARCECKAFIGQLYRTLEANGYKRDELPEGFSLVTKSASHDYGTYFEVVCKFIGDDERSEEIAYWLEGNCPELWDTIAQRELGKEVAA
jgi:hypothetical protein